MKELKGYQATAMANAEDAFERLMSCNKWVEFEAARAAWDIANEAWADACAAWFAAHNSYEDGQEAGHAAGYKAGYDAGYEDGQEVASGLGKVLLELGMKGKI